MGDVGQRIKGSPQNRFLEILGILSQREGGRGGSDPIPSFYQFTVVKGQKCDDMLSSTIIGVELHRLGLKFNFLRLVELQLDQN